jgi:DNA-binding NarL/FixJ family response regulator
LLSDFIDIHAGLLWNFGEVSTARLASSAFPAAAVPVLNPAQAARLSRLAHENPLTTLVGVVTDPSGVLTHQAIQAGASFVLNTLIAPEHSLAALETQLTSRTDDFGSVAIGPPAWFAAREPSPLADAGLGDEEALLVRLVCAGSTTAQLSARFFCSERSMYRRLRGIYNRFRVTSRRELCEVLARAGGWPPPRDLRRRSVQ